jgi:hypothetical protein
MRSNYNAEIENILSENPLRDSYEVHIGAMESQATTAMADRIATVEGVV